METALRTILTNTLNPFNNIHWVAAPKGSALPRVLIHLIDDPAQNTITDGRIKSLRRALIQIDVWGASMDEAHSLAQKITALDGVAQTGVISRMILNSKRTSDDQSGADVLFNYSFDFWVFYSEA